MDDLDTSDAMADSTAQGPEGPGARIDRYRLLKMIGEGGFGEVYEAEQLEPVQRRVALKLIIAGMNTREVIARFDAERQALAIMDHPHIAKVLDAGATPRGRPYFVMELVDGAPITEYCDQHQLTIVDRLKLFEQVCLAVQHAHTKGVIHRDLKPSNVLVSTHEDQPFAKIIDFGIAKAVSGRLTDRTLLTRQHQLVGTPLYMSPEQAAGSIDIDTRADVYALGALLYELLTGTTPFSPDSLQAASLAEMQRIIREVEPPRPSARLSESVDTLNHAASSSQSQPRRLTKTIRGELDWIVMKALEKERERRYDSANGLAQDIHRYLSGQPVKAAPPSRIYRLRKLIRRNKLLVSSALGVSTALLVGIIAFAWQARIAQQRADELEQVSKFQGEMLQRINAADAGRLISTTVRHHLEEALDSPDVSPSERQRSSKAFTKQWTKINDADLARDVVDGLILQPASDAVEAQFRDRPLIDATLSDVLAQRYRQLGMYDKALRMQLRALDLRRAQLGENHVATIEATHEAGLVLRMLGRSDEAEDYHRRAVEGFLALHDWPHDDTVTAIGNLAMILVDLGRAAEAEPLAREALQLGRQLNNPDPRSNWTEINNLAFVLQSLRQLEESESLFRELLNDQRELDGEDNGAFITTLNNLGGVLYLQGKLDETEECWRAVVESRRKHLGMDNPYTLRAAKNLVDVLLRKGNLIEAEPLAIDVADRSKRVLGAQHRETLIAEVSLIGVINALQRYSEVLKLATPIEAAAREQFTAANLPRLARLLLLMGIAHREQGAYGESEKRLLEARSILDLQPSLIASADSETTEAIVELYQQWNKAEPNADREASAERWRAKLGAPANNR